MKIFNIPITLLIKLALYCIFCAFVIQYISDWNQPLVWDNGSFIRIGILALLMYIGLVIDRFYLIKKQSEKKGSDEDSSNPL